MTVAAPIITLAEAKERIRIPDLWRELGLEGEPKKHCRCPFHEDRSPSFSIFDDGKGWKCHAGCGEGSAVDFLVKAKGLSDEEACIEILRRAGSNREVVRSERPKRELAVLELPPPVPYSKEIAQSVADSRGLGIAAVEFAALWLKTIVFGDSADRRLGFSPMPRASAPKLAESTQSRFRPSAPSLSAKAMPWPVLAKAGPWAFCHPRSMSRGSKSTFTISFWSKADLTISPLAKLSPRRT